jgi:hypothetical protein
VALGRTATSTRDDNFAKVCKELCTRALWRQISLYTDNPSCQNQHSFISLPPCIRRGRRFVLCNEPLCEISSNSQHHCYYNVLTLDHQILIHFMHTVVNWTIWYHMLVNCITYIYTVKQTIYIYIPPFSAAGFFRWLSRTSAASHAERWARKRCHEWCW